MITKAEIRHIKELTASSATRREHGLFIAEGRKLVGEIQGSPLVIRALYETGVNISPSDMARISALKTPTQVLALVEIPRYAAETGMLRPAPGELILALDGVQDPGNLGTIIRLCDWFGVRDVWCSSESVDCWNPKVVQATMGALTRIRVHYLNLPEFLGAAAARGQKIYGTFLERSRNLYDNGAIAASDGTGQAPGGILVMGSEGRGISPAVEALVTGRLYIPPYPATAPTGESLNVATATAIVLAEFRRRATAER